MGTILGVGTPFIDYLLRVSHDYLHQVAGERGGGVPVDSETFHRIIAKSGVSPIRIAGGSCCNTIKGLANLGHSCDIVGKIGRDSAATHFLAGLSHLPITPRFLVTDAPTAQLAVLVDPEGERTFRSLTQASQEMTGSELDSQLFQGKKLVHIEGYTLRCNSLTERAMALAQQAGALISFDLATFEIAKQYRETILKLLKGYVTVVFANQKEIEALTGQAGEKGCAILSELAEIGVVLKGREGCLVGKKGRVEAYPTFPVKSPVDTTGAGDLFASGFLHGMLQGYSLEESARLGALLGSTIVQYVGAEIPQEVWSSLRVKAALN
jgi:sugar/nucleoside kinase (ribokinase family)